MPEPDWKRINAALAQLDTLLAEGFEPGNHPTTLDEIQRLTAMLDIPQLPQDQCTQLRNLATAFYGDRSERYWPESEIDAHRRRMKQCVQAIGAKAQPGEPQK